MHRIRRIRPQAADLKASLVQRSVEAILTQRLEHAQPRRACIQLISAEMRGSGPGRIFFLPAPITATRARSICDDVRNGIFVIKSYHLQNGIPLGKSD